VVSIVIRVAFGATKQQQATSGLMQLNMDPVRPQQARRSIHSLPPEIMLGIVDLLPPETFINLALAYYPLLNACGLTPPLTPSRVSYITNRTHLPQFIPLSRMPPEIMLVIMSHLKPMDIMRFTVANYQNLERNRIAPALTNETIRRLGSAVRNSGAESYEGIT
jgi:hypothetical protein